MSAHLNAAASGETGPAWSLAGRFVEALTHRDFATIADCLDPEVHFRALLPPGPVDVRGPAEVLARFEKWFGGEDEVEMLDASIGEVGPRLYLRWRMRRTTAAAPEATLIVEQHAFVTAGHRIETIDLLCSGFVSEHM
jgi:hypothetical protein